MSDYVETVDLTDTCRLVVQYDTDRWGESPLEWSEDVSVHPLRTNSNYHQPREGVDSLGSRIDTILEHNGEERYDYRGRREYELTDEAAAAIDKMFARLGVPFIIGDLNADRDWVGLHIWYIEPNRLAESLVLHPEWDVAAYLKGVAKLYRQYAAGEVYTIGVERRVTYVLAGEEPGSVDWEQTHSHWEEVGYVGGVYFEDGYPTEKEIKEQALDVYDVEYTEDERAALGLTTKENA